MTAHNVRTIIGFTIIIAGIVWIFNGWIHESRKRRPKVICFILCCLLVIVLTAGMFLSISYKSFEVIGVVTDISSMGSWVGLMDTYTVEIKTNSGTPLRFHTSLFSSWKLKNL